MKKYLEATMIIIAILIVAYVAVDNKNYNALAQQKEQYENNVYGVVIKTMDNNTYVQLIDGDIVEVDYSEGLDKDIIVEITGDYDKFKAERVESAEKEYVLEKFEKEVQEIRQNPYKYGLITVESTGNRFIVGTDEIGYNYVVENNDYEVGDILFAVMNDEYDAIEKVFLQ